MYQPAKYWDQRLNRNFNLRGVGHQSYNLFYNKWLYKRKLQVLKDFFGSSNLENKSILDIGTGTGFFLQWYLGQGAQVSGIDISSSAIQKLSQKFPQAQLALLDFSGPSPSLPGQYHIINAWDVIYHQTEAIRFSQFLSNCARFCEKDGYLLLTDGFGLPNSVRAAEHVQFRNREDYAGIMTDLGFKLHQEIPLFRFLNRARSKNRIIRYLENFLAPIFFFLDQFQHKPAENNLSLCIWIKTVDT